MDYKQKAGKDEKEKSKELRIKRMKNKLGRMQEGQKGQNHMNKTYASIIKYISTWKSDFENGRLAE